MSKATDNKISKYAKTGDAVADDRNWIGTIKTELKCAEAWERDWGFFSGDTTLKLENATKVFTIDDRIRIVQEVFIFPMQFNFSGNRKT